MTDTTSMGALGWTLVSIRDERLPVLPLDGRRSIAAAWPEGSFCSICGTIQESGYVGPVAADRAIFPDRRLVLVCRPCAMEKIGVSEDGLDRHHCNPGCSDRLHLELILPHCPDRSCLPAKRADQADEVPAELSPADQKLTAAGRFEGSPWAVVDVTEVNRSLAARLGVLAEEEVWTAARALWIEIDRPLAWAEDVLT